MLSRGRINNIRKCHDDAVPVRTQLWPSSSSSSSSSSFYTARSEYCFPRATGRATSKVVEWQPPRPCGPLNSPTLPWDRHVYEIQRVSLAWGMFSLHVRKPCVYRDKPIYGCTGCTGVACDLPLWRMSTDFPPFFTVWLFFIFKITRGGGRENPLSRRSSPAHVAVVKVSVVMVAGVVVATETKVKLQRLCQ